MYKRQVLEDGLKASAIRIPGTLQDPHGFDSVHSVTSYLSAFGVTVAERIREQFQPLFDPAAEQLSPEILRINDHIREHAGYSLYPAQLAVAESVKRKLSEGKSAFIVAECGSGKTKIGATALAAYQAQKRKKTFNIVLCPSHVAKKWVREIAETLPETAGVIVRSITELDSLYAQYRQGDKSIYAVISKEKARDGYMRRPAVPVSYTHLDVYKRQASASRSAMHSAADGLFNSRAIYVTISTMSCTADSKYSTLYNLRSSNGIFHRFQNILGGIAFAGQLCFALGGLQLEVDFTFKLQVFKRFHAQNDHIAVAVFRQKHRLRGFVDGFGDLRKVVSQVGNRTDHVHSISLLSLTV